MARKNAINDLILVIYMPIGNLSQAAVYNMARDSSEALKKAIPEARVIAIPTKEETGRVDCINPKLIDKKEWDSVKNKIDIAEKTMEALIASLSISKPKINMEKEYIMSFKEKHSKIVELTNNLKVNTIHCSSSVACFIQDCNGYVAKENKTIVQDPKPYPIGTFNNINIMVDPFLKFDNLNVYDEDHNILFDLSKEGFKITDLI